jgi:hypothetical protein
MLYDKKFKQKTPRSTGKRKKLLDHDKGYLLKQRETTMKKPYLMVKE